MAAKKPKKRRSQKTFNAKKFVLNCIDSRGTDTDWSMADAASADIVDLSTPIPSKKDLRATWWSVDHQKDTGACVGFAAACGVLRWQYVEAGMISKSDRPSPRFIWMANKETDDITSHPTTFLESAGTQTKLALRVAQRYGCVMDKVLPMNGKLSPLNTTTFYSLAAQLRISSYFNLRQDLDDLRRWLAQRGPVITRLNVDSTWDQATSNNGDLDTYKPNTTRGGHAVCIVGYTKDRFIIRNSWGTTWGDEGFGYASEEYTAAAFSDRYGAII